MNNLRDLQVNGTARSISFTTNSSCFKINFMEKCLHGSSRHKRTQLLLVSDCIFFHRRLLPHGRSEGSNVHLVVGLGSLFKTHTHNRSYIIFCTLRRSSIQKFFFLVLQGYIVVLYNIYLLQKFASCLLTCIRGTSLRTRPRLWLCLLYAYLAPIDNIIIVV